MAIGIQPTLDQANQQLGNVASNLAVSLRRAHEMHAWYLSLGAGGMTNAPYSLTAGDDATIGSALADAEQLYQLFIGTASLASPKDFTTFLQRLWGFGF